MGYNVITWVILSLLSYPISHYLMTKGMILDLTIPDNHKRYKILGVIFRIPIVNIIILFTYLCYTIHKLKE